MKHKALHGWEMSPSEAVALQKQLRDRVVLQPLPDRIDLVAGADISYNRFSDVVYAGFVVLRLPSLEVVETAGIVSEMRFPYIPGLLSFRETPPLLQAWERLSTRPDVVMLDGQGLAHPRRFGIACHFGLLADIPTVGCAKKILVGVHAVLGEEAGSTAMLDHGGDVVGAIVRTKTGVKPVYISPGHLADVSTSVDLAFRCSLRAVARSTTLSPTRHPNAKYRIPEPTRLAHLFVNALRRSEEWSPPR